MTEHNGRVVDLEKGFCQTLFPGVDVIYGGESSQMDDFNTTIITFNVYVGVRSMVLYFCVRDMNNESCPYQIDGCDDPEDGNVIRLPGVNGTAHRMKLQSAAAHAITVKLLPVDG